MFANICRDLSWQISFDTTTQLRSVCHMSLIIPCNRHGCYRYTVDIVRDIDDDSDYSARRSVRRFNAAMSHKERRYYWPVTTVLSIEFIANVLIPPQTLWHYSRYVGYYLTHQTLYSQVKVDGHIVKVYVEYKNWYHGRLHGWCFDKPTWKLYRHGEVVMQIERSKGS